MRLASLSNTNYRSILVNLSTTLIIEKNNMAQIDKKIVDCYWYLQNQCAKGESCEYRHWKPALENPITCTDWQQGKCLNKECNFRHPSTAIANLGKKNVVCYYFTHGGCMKGSSCPYSHEVTEPEDEIQRLAQIKKKEELELRRLQEERLKEERRLAELKAQENYMKPKAEERTIKSKKLENPTAASFAKSVGEIQEQSLRNQGKRKNELKKEKNQDKKVNQGDKKKSLLGKRPTIAASEPVSNKNLDFGIKNLEELLKEKEEKEKLAKEPNNSSNGASATAPKTSSPPSSRKEVSIAEIRKRNEQKFKSQNPPANAPPKSEPQQKKIKTEVSSQSMPSAVPAAPTNPTPIEEDVNIEDDFDKELDELETLI